MNHQRDSILNTVHGVVPYVTLLILLYCGEERSQKNKKKGREIKNRKKQTAPSLTSSLLSRTHQNFVLCCAAVVALLPCVVPYTYWFRGSVVVASNKTHYSYYSSSRERAYCTHIKQIQFRSARLSALCSLPFIQNTKFDKHCQPIPLTLSLSSLSVCLKVFLHLVESVSFSQSLSLSLSPCT